MKNDRTSPFEARISAEVLSDLQQRLANTRWSRALEDVGWDAGTDVQYLRDLIRYWQSAYDWGKHETAINQFAHFKAARRIKSGSNVGEPDLNGARVPLR